MPIVATITTLAAASSVLPILMDELLHREGARRIS
jgi:hypothetical protein